MNTDDLRRHAEQILADNDRGGYTVPSPTIYPFQWNWDSCFTALGWKAFDPDRAWRELETLVDHQWDDGMIPHIVFHQDDDRYFPGPDVWDTGHRSPRASEGILTSGITQPPVLGMVIEALWIGSAPEHVATDGRAVPLVEAADRWHQWFVDARDPHGQGSVAIIHPWEAGRDNAVDWDEGLAAVRTELLLPYRRRDTDHVDAGERPTDADYDRYMSLLQTFRSHGWAQSILHDASPFCMIDPGFNACLIASDRSLARVASGLGLGDLATRATHRADAVTSALDALWHPPLGQFSCWNRVDGTHSDNASVGGLLPLLTLSPADPRSTSLMARLEHWMDVAPFGVASQDPTSRSFDAVRYWRGPSWLVINWLLVRGLRDHGRDDLARRLMESSLGSVSSSGFREYFNPMTGQGLGGHRFSWTASITLEFLAEARRC